MCLLVYGYKVVKNYSWNLESDVNIINYGRKKIFLWIVFVMVVYKCKR